MRKPVIRWAPKPETPGLFWFMGGYRTVPTPAKVTVTSQTERLHRELMRVVKWEQH